MANIGLMVTRARFAILIGLISVALISPGHAKPPGATFQAQTEGLPASTELGHWVIGERSAQLVFGGGHLVGENTTFVAQWTTPLLPGDAKWSGFGRMVARHNEPEPEPIRLERSFRYRYDSKPWSKWVRLRTRFTREMTVFEDYENVIWMGQPPSTIQYQWKLTGEISSGAILTGDYELHTD